MFYNYESIRKKVLQELSFDGKKVDEDDQDNDYTQDDQQPPEDNAPAQNNPPAQDPAPQPEDNAPAQNNPPAQDPTPQPEDNAPNDEEDVIPPDEPPDNPDNNDYTQNDEPPADDQTQNADNPPADDTNYDLPDDGAGQTDDTAGNDDAPTDYTQDDQPAADDAPADTGDAPAGDAPADGGDAPADDGTGDQTQDGADTGDDANGQDQLGTEINDLETKIFSNLSPEQISIQNTELKIQYIDLYKTIDKLVTRVDNLNKKESNLDTLDFISKKLQELKILVNDYIIKTYSTNGYLENQINLKKYLLVLEYINKMLSEINSYEKKNVQDKE